MSRPTRGTTLPTPPPSTHKSRHRLRGVVPPLAETGETCYSGDSQHTLHTRTAKASHTEGGAAGTVTPRGSLARQRRLTGRDTSPKHLSVTPSEGSVSPGIWRPQRPPFPWLYRWRHRGRVATRESFMTKAWAEVILGWSLTSRGRETNGQGRVGSRTIHNPTKTPYVTPRRRHFDSHPLPQIPGDVDMTDIKSHL